MKILCVCDKGVNRSVHFASQLKWWGNDTIAIGLDNTTPETLNMLYAWADKVIITEPNQQLKLPPIDDKVVLFNVGQDTYHRPFNPELLGKVKKFLEDNKHWLQHTNG